MPRVTNSIFRTEQRDRENSRPAHAQIRTGKMSRVTNRTYRTEQRDRENSRPAHAQIRIVKLPLVTNSTIRNIKGKLFSRMTFCKDLWFPSKYFLKWTASRDCRYSIFQSIHTSFKKEKQVYK